MVPPWASTKPRAMARPSPVPARRRSPACGAIELVEHAGRAPRRDARPLVAHDDLDRARRRAAPRSRCAPPAGEYFAALSRRLNSACSASTKSSDRVGRSGATRRRHAVLQDRRGAAQRGRDEVADIDRLALGHDGAGIEPGHVQKIADEAVEALGLAQRRAQKLVARRPRRSASRSSCRLASAPMIEASGVRRSCATEVSMAERRRSRSAPSRAWSMSSARCTRSMATAAWLPTASSSRRSAARERMARA